MFNFKELVAYLTANNISMESQEVVRRGLAGMEWSVDDISAAIVLLEAGGVFTAPAAEIMTDGVRDHRQFESSISEVSAPVRTVIQMNNDQSLLRRIHSNTKLDPASINKLLGVDVDFTVESKEVRKVLRTPRMTGADQFVALLLASLLSTGILFGAMYHYQFGVFHHTSSFAAYFDFNKI